MKWHPLNIILTILVAGVSFFNAYLYFTSVQYASRTEFQIKNLEDANNVINQILERAEFVFDQKSDVGIIERNQTFPQLQQKLSDDQLFILNLNKQRDTLDQKLANYSNFYVSYSRPRFIITIPDSMIYFAQQINNYEPFEKTDVIINNQETPYSTSLYYKIPYAETIDVEMQLIKLNIEEKRIDTTCFIKMLEIKNYRNKK